MGIRKINLLIFILSFCSVEAASGDQPYIKSAELLCDGTKVAVTTLCSDDSSLVYPKCQSQSLAFTNLATNKVVTTRSTQAITVKMFGSEMIDGLAGSWACLKGKNNTYLVVRFYNGGNCEECEWLEIYDLDGRNLTPKSRKHRSEFGERFGALCLQENWKEVLISIPLRRGDK